MRRSIIVLLALFTATSVAAAQQQPPDPIVMQRALNSLQAQRNQAMDAAAAQEVRAAGLAEELAKAQARLKELEPKPADPKN
ncbi:hypothetical protein [Bradyrhizobium sp.]